MSTEAITYAECINVEKENYTDTDNSKQEIGAVKNEENTNKIDYFIENDSLIYNLTKDLQNDWEHLGLMTDITDRDIWAILTDTMIIRKIEISDLDVEDDSDWYSDEDR